MKLHLNQNKVEQLKESSIIDFVFKSLNKEIVINNSENYYYFDFYLNGRYFKGNIGLLVNEREKNLVSFYCEEITNIEKKYYTPISIEKVLNKEFGLILKKISLNKYELNYKSTKIKINIESKLFKQNINFDNLSNTLIIGDVYDDSGLEFNFYYNEKYNYFFYILDNFQNENLTHFVKLNTNVLVEMRSGFAFFKDKFDNKILIGVLKDNEDNNNFYDGPFDQLPDNQILVNKIDIGKLIKNANINIENELDNFGNYKNDNDYRVAINAYYSYTDIEDLMNHFYEIQTNSYDEELFLKNLTKVR